MQSTIKKIYEKELGYYENFPADKEYQERTEEYNKAYNALYDTLNEEQKKLLSELFICEGGVQSALEFVSFKDGFRAGVWLGIELNEEDK